MFIFNMLKLIHILPPYQWHAFVMIPKKYVSFNAKHKMVHLLNLLYVKDSKSLNSYVLFFIFLLYYSLYIYKKCNKPLT